MASSSAPGHNHESLQRATTVQIYLIIDMLSHVQITAEYDSIYPMFVFAIYTGARRGEIRRSLIDDFDFEVGQVKLRERKRRKGHGSE